MEFCASQFLRGCARRRRENQLCERGEVMVTNVDKLYWKKEKITKGDLLKYYAAVAKYILPYLKNRPLVLHRFPDGVGGVHFYQKESGPNLPSFVKTVPIQHEERKISYFVVQNVKTLLYVANLGAIELHPFHGRIPKIDKPDYLVLDLDPQNVPFDTVVDVAQEIHEILDGMKIPSFCKTSGGRGLHIYIPLRGKYSYDEVKKYAVALAKIAHKRLPKITSLARNPKERKEKVYIDFLQNHKMQTVVSPYSVRGGAGATVSTPLSWSEVGHGIEPSQFTLKNVPKLLAQKGDPFKGVLQKGADLKRIFARKK